MPKENYLRERSALQAKPVAFLPSGPRFRYHICASARTSACSWRPGLKLPELRIWHKLPEMVVAVTTDLVEVTKLWEAHKNYKSRPRISIFCHYHRSQSRNASPEMTHSIVHYTCHMFFALIIVNRRFERTTIEQSCLCSAFRTFSWIWHQQASTQSDIAKTVTIMIDLQQVSSQNYASHSD